MNKMARSTVLNLFWNYGSFAANKLVTFVTTIILARILTPDDFGLLAIALILLEYVEKINRFGIDSAVIYQKGDINKITNTAFLVSLFIGAVITGITILIAPFVGDFFKEPRVIPIVQVLAISLFITNLGNIHQARLMKQLDFKKRTIPEVGRALVKGIASVLFALAGFGVWSLVWGRVIGVVAGTIMYWYVERWIPHFEIDFQLARKLLSYGFQIILIGIQATIFNNIDYLIIGHQMDAEQLGYYTMAYRLPELLIIGLVIIAGQAIFPSLAASQDNLDLMRRSYIKMLGYLTMLVVPMGLGLALTANDFIILVYSDQWAPSIVPAQILAIYSITYALAYNTGDIFKAIGKPSIVTIIGFIRVIIVVPVLLYAAQFTISHVAAGQLITNIFIMFITIGISLYFLKIKAMDVIRAIYVPIIGGIVMASCILLLNPIIMPLPLIVRLSISVIVGGISYCLSLYVLDSQSVETAIELVFNRKKPVN